jgi:hexosaminidase
LKKALFLSILLLLMACSGRVSRQLSIIPQPREIALHNGTSRFQQPLRIAVKDTALTPCVEIFRTHLKQWLSIGSVISDRGKVVIAMDTSLEFSEGYRLIIHDNNIRLTAKTPQGIHNGLQSLIQIMSAARTDQKRLVLPNCEIWDYPRFSYRGMHLDVSRHYFPVEFIEKYIDIMALYKINTFHWHLTDDQGWRIEIKKYPRLTDIGAWRKGTGQEEWNYFTELPAPGGEKYGGFYTQEEIRTVVRYASARGITVVPEIEMPGHSWAALAAYPELSCSGKIFKKPKNVSWEFTDPYCAGNEKTFRFLEDILDEVMGLFPGEYIHIGGDEAKKTPWENCPRCQERMMKMGLQNVEELQSYFIQRIEKYLNSKGRKIIGWDEILEGGLAPNATVMSWRGDSGGIKAAESRHYAIMTPGEYLYLNNYQDMADNELAESGGYIPLEKVYHYEPVPGNLPPTIQQYILGAQANVWTENLKTPDQVEDMVLPRLCALAELTWTQSSGKDFSGFLKRLGSQYPLWDNINIHYHIPRVGGIYKELKFIDTCSLLMVNPICYGQILFTADGSDPDLNSPVCHKKIELTSNAVVKACIILPSGKAGPITTGHCMKVEPLAPTTGTANYAPGIEYEYYEAKLSSLDEMNDLQALKHGTMSCLEIPPRVREDYWAIEFSGYLKADSTAVYTFYTMSDDGSRLYIGNNLVVNNDGIHGIQIRTGQVALEKGYHKIKVRFFEAGFGQYLEAGVVGSNNEKIPLTGKLFHEQDGSNAFY